MAIMLCHSKKFLDNFIRGRRKLTKEERKRSAGFIDIFENESMVFGNYKKYHKVVMVEL